MKLLVSQFLKFVHDTVDTILVDEALRQPSALVEDEVDANVVEDVLFQLLVQLFFELLLLGERVLFGTLNLRNRVHFVGSGGPRHVQGRQGGCGGLKVVSHSNGLEWLADFVAYFKVAPSLPGHVDFGLCLRYRLLPKREQISKSRDIFDQPEGQARLPCQIQRLTAQPG